MDKPNLTQYFSETEVPPASQFFDEIGTVPIDTVQSVNLGKSEGNLSENPKSEDMFSNLSPFSQSKRTVVDANIMPVPTVSGSTAVPASSLPDPSTFFDTIGPEPIVTSPSVPHDTLAQAFDNLSIKPKKTEKQVDIEGDRRRDAWIPNKEAKKTLLKAQSSPKGSFFPEREVMTMPGLVLEEELADVLQEVAVKYLGVSEAGSRVVMRQEHISWGEADALQEVAVKYLGVSEAGSRVVMRQEHVSRDEAGLRELIRSGCLRAAVNLTHTLLEAHGQGIGRMNRPTKHNPRSLQLWLTRFGLLIKIRLYDVVVKEAEPFGDLSKPDLYYQFYPEVYGDRAGTMVPFSLRVLLADLPLLVGKPEQAMPKLYSLMDCIGQMLKNLKEGKTEDGSGKLATETDKKDSIQLWTTRESRVKHSIVNCALAMKDYRLAISVIESDLVNSTPAKKRNLLSALCRICARAGHSHAALNYLRRAAELRAHICPTPDVREYVDMGLLDMCLGKYQDAYNNFAKAADQEPTNIMVANSLSVCLLYMGRIKEAIAILQNAITSDPERGLHEKILINLCTLYELESSKTHEKKLNLLRMLCKYKSDTIPNVLECLKLT